MLLGGSEALGKGESARAAAEGQLPGDVLYSRSRPGAVLQCSCPSDRSRRDRTYVASQKFRILTGQICLYGTAHRGLNI